MTLKQEIESEVLKLDPKLSVDDEAFKAASVLLCVLKMQSFDQAKVATELEIPISTIAKFFYNLRKSKVFRGRKIHANWADPEEGGIAFWTDCAVAMGLMERASGARTSKISK